MPTVCLLLLIVSLTVCALLLRRRPNEGLGLPLVALGVFAFVYVLQPIYLMSDDTLSAFLTPAQTAKGLFLPAVTLPLFVAGWLRAAPRRGIPLAPWHPHRLWNFGCITAAVGTVLYLVFIGRSGGVDQAFGQAHGGGASWNSNTAYLYFGPWWCLSGISMMLLAAPRIPNELRRWIVPACFASALFLNAILLSSRGNLFATSVTILAALCLGLRLPVPFSRAVPVAVLAGLGVLLLLGFRSVLHLGDTGTTPPPFSSALTAAMQIEPRQAAYRTTGNEFVYHAAAVDTVDETGKHHWGLPWLFIYTLHPIPRILWPDKPYTFPSSGITWDDIRTVTGITISGGAAPGIVADLYWHFGWFSLPFFYVFGMSAGRLFLRAQSLESPLATVAYTLLLALGLNAFAQGFGAILVTFPYSVAPAVAFTIVERAAVRPRGAAAPLAAHPRYSS